MDTKSHAAAFREAVQIWERGAVDELVRVTHENYVGHTPLGDRDLVGLRQRILDFHASYRDLRFIVEDQICEGDRVASHMTATATRASDGKTIRLYGLNLSRFRDNKMIEEWMTWELREA
jgi:predicted ester cyclase